jgi:hypothetical protein
LKLQLDLRTEDLPSGYLGFAEITTYSADGLPAAGILRIDTDASGRGWFLDPTPNDASEFTPSAYAPYAWQGGPAGFDLYSVVLHEVGHLFGITDQFAGFAGKLTTTADGQTWFAASGQQVPVTSDGHHVDPDYYPLDLLAPVLHASERKYPSPLDALLLREARDAALPASGNNHGAAIEAELGFRISEEAVSTVTPVVTSALAPARLVPLFILPAAPQQSVAIVHAAQIVPPNFPFSASPTRTVEPSPGVLLALGGEARGSAASSIQTPFAWEGLSLPQATQACGECQASRGGMPTDVASATSLIDFAFAADSNTLPSQPILAGALPDLGDAGIGSLRQLSNHPLLAFAAAALGILAWQALHPGRNEEETEVFDTEEDFWLFVDDLPSRSGTGAKEFFEQEELVDELLSGEV